MRLGASRGQQGPGVKGSRAALRNVDLSQNLGNKGGFKQVKCQMGDETGHPACSAGDKHERGPQFHCLTFLSRLCSVWLGIAARLTPETVFSALSWLPSGFVQGETVTND